MKMRETNVLAAVAAAALAAACASRSGQSPASRAGRVELSVASSALSTAAEVNAVALSMTNLDTGWSTSGALSRPVGAGPSTWSGVFAPVPAGPYAFHAEASDAQGNILFQTADPFPSTPVVVTAGKTSTVHLILQQAHPPTPFANSAPSFTSAVASESESNGARTVLLTATAEDPDGEPLAFTWSSAGRGAFGRQTDTATSTATSWTPPATGDFELTATATDPRGASASVSLRVGITDAGAAVVAVLDLNHSPIVISVTNAPASGGAIPVTATAKDVDGDALTFGEWRSDCGGSFTTSPTAVDGQAKIAVSSTAFTSPAGQSRGRCTLTAVVSDGRGGTGSGTIGLELGGGALVYGSMSSPSVLAPGESAKLRVFATDGISPSPWTIAWSDGLAAPKAGRFAVEASEGACAATYTPASCLDLGLGDHAITATATATNAASTQSASIAFAFTVRCAPAATGSVSVKLLAINDFHGQISAGKKVGTSAVGSAPVLAAYLRSAMKGKEEATVLVEAGDLVGASQASSALLQDEPTLSFFNLFANDKCPVLPPPALQIAGEGRFDALFDPGCNLVGVPGNHEFDEGVDELLRLLGGGNHVNGPFLEDPWRGARFPLVSSNIRGQDGHLLFRPYAVKYISGVQVGFIGATFAGTPSIVVPAGVAGLTFDDEAVAINAQVKELQARGIHAIAVVLHDGAYQSGGYSGPTKPTQAPPAELAALVAKLDADVDVLITGHSHNFANEYALNAGGNRVLVTQAYSSGTAYADIDLVVDGATQDVTSKVASVVTTYASDLSGKPTFPPDPAAAALTAAAEARVAPLAGARVATTNAVISSSLDDAGESPLGDLLAEAQRQSVGAELGLTNPGGMRASLPASCPASPCAITWNDCFTAQPFGNQVMKVMLTGQQLAEALEQQFAGWAGQTQTRMLQIAGFAYSWSASAPLGAKVVPGSLRKTDGTPIDPATHYAVAMNNYLQGGGDGFTVFKAGTNPIPGPVDNDALVAYLKSLTGNVTPATDGRVNRVP
jgi:5'-nucleotidase